jgi:4-aminobutyrate aminotransferase
LVVEGGEGAIVRGVDGNEYIDFNSGIAVLNVGQCHPRVVKAIKEKCAKFMHYSYTDFRYTEPVELAERLAKITPGDFSKKFFFANSGTEAIEAALKVTKWHTRKQLFIAFIGAFHGRTHGSIALAASNPAHKKHFHPLMYGVTHVPYAYCYRCALKMTYPECNFWCVDFIDKWVLSKYVPPEDTVGFVVEPILGEFGYIPPPKGYLQRLKKLAHDYGLLMIVDEIHTGVGRTGKMWAVEHEGVVPDVMTMAKAIGGGCMPLSVTMTKAEIMDWEPGAHCVTTGGNPVSCAAAMAVLDIMEEENLFEKAAEMGDYMLKRLKEMQENNPLIGDVRGRGLMIGVEIVRDQKTKEPASVEAKELVTRAWKRGVLMITGGMSTVRMAPPLIISKELVDKGLEIFEATAREIAQEKMKNK